MTTPIKIIGLTGPKGSGKDTVASLLRTHAGFYPLAYADALREEVCDAWRFEPLYLIRPETKEHPLSALALRKCLNDGFVARMVLEHSERGAKLDLDAPRSPRQILQWWGTEYRRRQRVTYWTEKVREHIAQLHLLDGRTRFVIADARFENEAHMIRAMGGVVWQITRDGIERVEGQHASATDGSRLAPSVVIDNSDTLHSLREAVLGEWLALETQIDVISLDLADPAQRGADKAPRFSLADPAAGAPSPAGDDHQALTFGPLP